MAGTPPYPDDWATRFKALEDRVKALFTAAQSRVAYAKIVASLLTVGDGTQRIEIDPATKTITFYLTDSPAAQLTASAYGGSEATGLSMESVNEANTVITVDTTARVESGGYHAQLHAESSTGPVAQADVQVNDALAAITIAAQGGGTDDSISLQTDGQITLDPDGDLYLSPGTGVWIQGIGTTPGAFAGGGYLYATSAGALRWRGPTTNTVIAPA